MQVSMHSMTKSTFADEERAAVRRFMNEHGLKDHPWSQAAKVSNGVLRKYLSGQTESLKQNTWAKYARAANTSVDVLLGRTRAPKIKILAHMKSQEVIFYSDYSVAEINSLRPDLKTDKAYVVLVEDTSLGLPIGTTLYVLEEDKTLDDLVGKYCLITTAENKSYIKNIEKGSKPKTFTLWSLNSSPMHDVKLKYAARIISFELPR